MSESVICNVCGSANRAKAKFCTGCARPLPGFEPSGPSALDSVMSLRPASDAPGRGDFAVPVLPAETAAFWLKAAYWGLAMIIGFTLWCLYVTSKPGAPPLKAEIMGLLAPVMNTSPSPVAPAVTTPPVAPVGDAAPVAVAPGTATSPIHALLPGRSGGSAEPSPQPAERRMADAPGARSEARAAPRPSKASASAYASRATRERPAEPAVTPRTRASERPSGEPDPGPPIAIGPGPLYDYSRMPPAAAPVSAPRPAQDPGPPIAIGPGPLVDYSARGSGTR